MKFPTTTAAFLMLATPSAQAWSSGYGYFSSPLVIQSRKSSSCSPPPASVIRRKQRALAKRMWERTDKLLQEKAASSIRLTYPRYEVRDEDDKFELSIDVPGVRPEDLDVSLEDEEWGPRLTISGQRATSNDTTQYSSKFSQSFSLDPSVDVEKFSASLNNGVLVVTAPKELKKVEENIRKIPIATTAVPPGSVVGENDNGSTSSDTDEATKATATTTGPDSPSVDGTDESVTGTATAANTEIPVDVKKKSDEHEAKDGGEKRDDGTDAKA